MEKYLRSGAKFPGALKVKYNKAVDVYFFAIYT